MPLPVSGAVDARGAATDFGKQRRLLTAPDYSSVFEQNEARASHRHFLLLGKRSPTPVSRLGLVIAKKNVRKAVQRNRVKRLVREWFRQMPDQDPAIDVVFLARRGVDQLDNRVLSSILREQWRKLVRQLPAEPQTDQRAE